MLGITHSAAGMFLGALAGSAWGGGISGAAWGVVAGGMAALLPDVDHPGSAAGRALRPLSVYLEERWGHRDSPTHTALFVLLVALPFAVPWLFFDYSGVIFVAAVIGGASHIALDSRTKSGVRPWRYLKFIPRRWREAVIRGDLETGKSPLEWALAAGFFAGTIILAYVNFSKNYI